MTLLMFGYNVTNLGGASSHIRDKIILSIEVDNASDMPTDILNTLKIYVCDSENLSEQRENIREGNDSEYTRVVLTKNNSLSTATSFIYEYEMEASSIMNGVGAKADIEIGGISNFDTRYILYFDKDANSNYQKASITYEVRVEAIQYRNNHTPNWMGI